MKKASLFLIILGLLCSSCEKTPVKKWTRLYGFTKEDIVGHYDANPDPSIYEDLPTEGANIYDNASIDIIPLSDNNISLRITIPDVLNKTFSGPLSTVSNRTYISFYNTNEDFMATVFTDNENQVRLDGRVKKYLSKGETPDCRVYEFDVIKKAAQ